MCTHKPVDKPDDKVIWSRPGPPAPTYSEVVREMRAAAQVAYRCRTVMAFQILARIQAEEELAEFRAKLCLLMGAEPQLKPKVVKERRRPGPRRIAA